MTNEFNPDWMCVCGDLTTLGVVHRKDGPCYMPEPKREWVGLTENEKADVLIGSDGRIMDYDDVVDAVEAKLKEKNNE
jgi:hypothetical protein